jgi:hypothetical protein
MASVKQLMQSLKADVWRKDHPFSSEINEANKVIVNRFATDIEKAKALALWLRSHQPCLFGRMAAAKGRMHYCILSDEDLYSSDSHIRAKIGQERLVWKQASLKNDRPAHGFILLAASEKINLAAPDDNLYRLACRLRDLWGCVVDRDKYGNDVAWETLFLRDPTHQQYVKFTFSLDFFGAQGDGRWWHDHRVPGGIAFTANSIGHMARSREWYESKGPQIEWAVELAMLTVDAAAQTEWGKAIWLEDLKDGAPARGHGCPFKDSAAIKEKLRLKDWSYYAGYLSTDHSVRKELFRMDASVPGDVSRKWLQDLTYLYDEKEPDRKTFMDGEVISEKDVFAEIGSPETWRVMPVSGRVISRTAEQEQEILTLLSEMENKWAPDEMLIE